MAHADIPSCILSGRILQGQAPASREVNLEALARFNSAGAVREFLQAEIDNGVGAMMTLGEAHIVAALRDVRSAGGSLAVLPVIPNVPGYVREATEYGMIGAGLRRLARVGPVGFVRAVLAGARHPLKALRKDFPTMLEVLYEFEMGEFQKFRPPAVFLHHQMTDLLLSFGNRDAFVAYARVMRRRFRTEPGLATANFARLAEALEAWDVPISLIAAPLNREGFLMPGGLDACRPFLASGRFRLIADRLAPEAPTPDAARDWAVQQDGVIACVVDSAPPS